MWAKKYLQEIQRMEEQINQRLEELSSLKALYGLKGCGLSERVQTSQRGDGLDNEAIKCVELERQIREQIQEFTNKKNIIISRIQALTDIRCIQVLYRRYVRYMSFESIAVELNYSYDHVTRIHKKALVDFETCHTMSVSNVI